MSSLIPRLKLSNPDDVQIPKIVPQETNNSQSLTPRDNPTLRDKISNITQKLKEFAFSPRSRSSSTDSETTPLNSPRPKLQGTSLQSKNSPEKISKLVEVFSPRKRSESINPVEVVHTFFTKECDTLFSYAIENKPFSKEMSESLLKLTTKFQSIPVDLLKSLIEKEIKTAETQNLNKVFYVLQFSEMKSLKQTELLFEFIDIEVRDQLQLRCRNNKLTRDRVNDLLKIIAQTPHEVINAPVLHDYIIKFLSQPTHEPEAAFFIQKANKYHEHCCIMEREKKTEDNVFLYQKKVFAKMVAQSLEKNPLNVKKEDLKLVTEAMKNIDTNPISKDIFTKVYSHIVSDISKNHLQVATTSGDRFYESAEFAQMCIKNNLPIFTITNHILDLYKR